MKRISARRVASVIATAMAMTLVFATLGWAMMPQWNTRPYTKHIAIASADTTITPAHANIPTRGDIVRVKPDYPSRPATASRYPPYYVNRSTLPVHARLVCSFTGPVPAVPRISAISPTPWPLPAS